MQNISCSPIRNSPPDGAVAELFALEVIAIIGIVAGSEDAVDDSVDETTLDVVLAAKQQVFTGFSPSIESVRMNAHLVHFFNEFPVMAE